MLYTEGHFKCPKQLDSTLAIINSICFPLSYVVSFKCISCRVPNRISKSVSKKISDKFCEDVSTIVSETVLVGSGMRKRKWDFRG